MNDIVNGKKDKNIPSLISSKPKPCKGLMYLPNLIVF